MNDAVLQAIMRAAVEATAATQGWIAGTAAGRLVVVAAAGLDAGRLPGVTFPPGVGSAGFVIDSGHPLTMAPGSNNPRFGEGIAAVLGRRPASILSVPCATDDGVLGALELIDKGGGEMFSLDDVEVATLLADVAGAALAAESSRPPAVAEPAQLGRELQRLASTDPSRYAAVATALSALLAQ